MQISTSAFVGVFSLAGMALAAPVNFVATATYDDASNANAIDSTAPGSVTPAAFQTLLTPAFTAGLGGVVQFEPATGPAGAQRLADGTIDGFTTTYGVGKTLNVGASAPIRRTNFASASQLSGVHNLDTSDATGVGSGFPATGSETFVLSLGPITGGLPFEAVTSVALTANSRNSNPGDVSMTATYVNPVTNATTAQTLTDAIAGTVATDDTFYGFTAPAGTYISSLSVTRSALIPFDDLGFVTAVVVPEPASLGLLGLGGLALLRRRR